ncbi:MAG: hypothetical protein A07HR60_00688 [uncultured archaeon A07HR60]|jgi:hypothetical protein|nr:MAG: hypothetical protein A07HR60_00688 [uncultured archaeon A07HR60]
MVDETLLAGLVVLSTVGGALTFFGYSLAPRLLGIAGAVSGGIAGAGGAFGVVPLVSAGVPIETRIAVSAGGLLVGAILGYRLLPVVGRLAAGAAGFVASAAAVVVVLLGEQLSAVAVRVLDPAILRDPAAFGEILLDAPVFESTPLPETTAIALGVGLVGALLALRFYYSLIALTATGTGAVLLGGVIPLWQEFIQTGSIATTAETVSPTWVGIAFVAGVVVQYFRYSDVISIGNNSSAG